MNPPNSPMLIFSLQRTHHSLRCFVDSARAVFCGWEAERQISLHTLKKHLRSPPLLRHLGQIQVTASNKAQSLQRGRCTISVHFLIKRTGAAFMDSTSDRERRKMPLKKQKPSAASLVPASWRSKLATSLMQSAGTVRMVIVQTTTSANGWSSTKQSLHVYLTQNLQDRTFHTNYP